MTKLRSAGYKNEITPLSEAVSDYVENFLNKSDRFLS